MQKFFGRLRNQGNAEGFRRLRIKAGVWYEAAKGGRYVQVRGDGVDVFPVKPPHSSTSQAIGSPERRHFR
jgi:hypothetical protein